MIEKLFIPTKERFDKQLTYKNLPDKWKKITYLVVNYNDDVSKYGHGINVIKLKKETNGIAEVKREIVFMAKDIKFGILDDDLNFRETIMIRNNKKNVILTDDNFDKMFKEIDETLDKYVMCGLATSAYPPHIKQYEECFRIMQTVFYNGKILPKNYINWTKIPFAEDHYVNLQLLTMGYKNLIFFKYKTNAKATNQRGGCSGYRTLNLHNESMRMLNKEFPNYVKLRKKVSKTDKKWGDIEKEAATIYWKKAYNSSKLNTLNGYLINNGGDINE